MQRKEKECLFFTVRLPGSQTEGRGGRKKKEENRISRGEGKIGGSERTLLLLSWMPSARE